MKSKICILSLLLICFFVQDCFSNSNKSNTINSTKSKKSRTKDICWTGTINGKTPVLIHYQLDNEVIIGEIIYLKNKAKVPIRLVGTIQNWDKKYRLLEFDKDGNITGIIIGLPEKNEFNGIWTSPKTIKELSLNLSVKDTVIFSKNYRPDLYEICGDYHYQFGDNGYQGDFSLKKLDKGLASFSISSVTGEPERNIATIDPFISNLAEEFIYVIPGTYACEFFIKFYKDFVFVKYTNGTCIGQFGHNATIEGIYFKTK